MVSEMKCDFHGECVECRYAICHCIHSQCDLQCPFAYGGNKQETLTFPSEPSALDQIEFKCDFHGKCLTCQDASCMCIHSQFSAQCQNVYLVNRQPEASTSGAGLSVAAKETSTEPDNTQVEEQRTDLQQIICHQCGASYRSGFLHDHNRSTRHKQAIRDIARFQVTHPMYGELVRKSNHANNADYIFPGYDDYKSILCEYDQKHPGFSVSFDNIPSSSCVNEKLDFKEKILRNLEEIDSFLNFYKKGIIFCVNEALQKHKNIKINLKLNTVIYKVPIDGSNIMYQYFGIHSKGKELSLTTDVNSWYEKSLIPEMQWKFEDSSHVGSNWSLFTILDLELNISTYKPLSASSYIELPESIANKTAVINIQNEKDHKCFFYSIVCKFLSESTPHKESMYHYKPALLKKVSFRGINRNGPTSLKEISIFEKKIIKLQLMCMDSQNQRKILASILYIFLSVIIRTIIGTYCT